MSVGAVPDLTKTVRPRPTKPIPAEGMTMLGDPPSAAAPTPEVPVEPATTAPALSPEESPEARLAAMTGQQSPYMDLARQQGLLTAQSRGLQNTSLAAGASMAEAVKQAAPVATSGAQLALESRMMKETGEQALALEGARTEGELEVQGAGAEQTLTRDQLLMEQEIERAGSALLNELGLAEATAEYDQALQEMKNTALLASTAIEGEFRLLVQESVDVAEMWKSYQTAVGNVMNNKDLSPAKSKVALEVLNRALVAGVDAWDAMSNLDMGEFGGGLPIREGTTTVTTEGGTEQDGIDIARDILTESTESEEWLNTQTIPTYGTPEFWAWTVTIPQELRRPPV